MLKRLLINTGSNVVQLVVSMVVTFLMAPFYLEMMGHHDYGLREMVLALVGYLGMLDLGMRPTVSRFASMHNAQADREQLIRVYATSLMFMITIGILLALFFWLWALWFPGILLEQDGSETRKYALFLMIIGIQVMFAFPRFVSESFLEGLQRYYLKNAVNITGTVGISVLSYLYMTPANALLLFTGLSAGFALVKLILFSLMLTPGRVGAIYPDLREFQWPKLREMLQFGSKSFIQGAAQKIETMSDRLVIGALLGPAMVPVYTIPFTLVGYVNSITMTLSHAFMPLFSDLNARGQAHRIKRVYLLSSKVLVGLVLPMGLGVTLVGTPFIEVWMKGQFDPETVNAIIVLIALYIVVPKLNPFASRYLTAINEHGIFARVAPIAALVNLGLSVWAVTEIGVIGAALGSVFPVFVVTPIFLRKACLHLGIPMSEYVRRCLLPAVIPTLIMGAVVFWLRVEWGLTDYARIVAAILLGAAIYCLAFWGLAMNRDERQWLMASVMRQPESDGAGDD